MNWFFSGDFQGQEGVRIMHQCALYNPKYGIQKLSEFTVYVFLLYVTYVYLIISLSYGIHHGRDRMVVGFTTTCAMDAYLH